ncbi:alpha/beta hydrolase [Legionella hackeliae]|uniref:Serine aminopeptidase S33 domain-containing protein n=1 Tax=Legionella hackeliae TaxID=449 RepID=A0A0A8UZF6_LEGHA|nr:alpha/beta hydrolase [Legionella hackeliae]KTD12686.1 Alpha/beta hydrolase family protein [Legionella hackeliae]CEK12104.1 conserved protein of unknown function [Legionella hackeliae]STX48891.1 Bem46 protein [Legionella hackeliae]
MIKQVFLISTVIFVIASLFMYFMQRNLMYFPAKEVPSRKFFHADDMQVVKIQTKDGIHLMSWYKPPIPGKPTILYLHGNAGHIGYRMPLVRQFLAAGLGVLLLEYRGYGGNPGHPSEQGLYRDGEAGFNFLQQQGVPAQQTILYGESLGTGVATYLSTQFSVCAVILQSPYTSMTNVARYHYPWVFIAPWDKYDSLSRISQVKSPLLILQGENDTIVPYEQAHILFENANQPKEFIHLPGRGHNDLWDNKFVKDLLDFIGAHCS